MLSYARATVSLIMIFCVSINLFADINPQDDPPEIATVDTLLYENFSGTLGPLTEINLPDWTVIDSGTAEWDETSWSRYINTPYPDYWNGDLCRVMFSGPNSTGDWLISPYLDCSADNAITFSFKHRHSNRTSSDNDTVFVYGSIDGGQNWDYTLYMSTESVGELNHPDTVEMDISIWAAGESNVRVAYYFKGDDVLTWYIDEPFVSGNFNDTLLYEDFNGSWGPFGDNPPAGWTITNEASDPLNNNDWSRWEYSTWPDTVALAYDNMNDQTADEWLITPTLSYSPNAICSLSFYNSYWDHSSDPSDSALILGSIDGGINWDYSVVIYTDVDDRDVNKEDSWRGFDISSWAQGQSDVKIAFHYVKDDPSFLGWWFFDDLLIREFPVSGDNVAAISVDHPTEFIVVDNDYFAQATINNLSLTQQTIDLDLNVKDSENNEIFSYTESGIVLDSLEITQVTFSASFAPESEGLHTISVIIDNPGDDDAADDTASVSIMSYQHQGWGGPDNYGYIFVDNTGNGGPEYNWIEISNTGTQVNPGDHYFMSEGIAMGFDINFYGQSYSEIWINSHGELHLGSRGDWLGSNDCPLPDDSSPNTPLLAVFWDMLYIHHEIGQGVYYQLFDDPGYSHFVVQWQAEINNIELDSVIFEAILYEYGDIVYQYKYVNPYEGGQGQAATIGIEDDSLPAGLVYNCDDANPANRLENGLAIAWFNAINDINDENLNLPEKFLLGQNYPNPFNAATTIFFDLAEPSEVKLEITDILGRAVETIINDFMQSGSYSVIWDASAQSSGIYFYRISAGSFTDTNKMILIK